MRLNVDSTLEELDKLLEEQRRNDALLLEDDTVPTGTLPDTTDTKLNDMRVARKNQQDMNDALLEEELRELDQTAPVIVRDPFQPPAGLPIRQAAEEVQEQSPIPQVQQLPDINQLISEYAKATKDSYEQKRDVANREALSNLFSAGVSFAGQAKPTANVEYKALRDLADEPLDVLENRDKGQATQQRLSAAEIALRDTKNYSDPQSEVSQLARDKYAKLLARMGNVDLAEKIRTGTRSATELDALFKGQISTREAVGADTKINPMDEFAAKEEIKEDVKVRTENRKTKKELEKNLESTENLIKDLERTQEIFNKYSKNTPGGTGPMATLGGLTKYTSADAQNLDAQFKKLNLDTMAKLFQGMSKAVDSDAERRAFEAAQPSLTNDDNVNRRLIQDRLQAARSLATKLKKAANSIDQRGNFVEPVREEQAPKSNKPSWAK